MAPLPEDDRKTSSNGGNSSQDAQTGANSANQTPTGDVKKEEPKKKTMGERVKGLWAKTGLDQRTMMTMAK